MVAHSGLRVIMRDFLAKLLFCDVYDLDNVVLHIPVGVINTLLCLFSGWIALVFGLGFIVYEVVQLVKGKITGDKAYPDIQGWLWGIALTGIPILIIGAVNGI